MTAREATIEVALKAHNPCHSHVQDGTTVNIGTGIAVHGAVHHGTVVHAAAVRVEAIHHGMGARGAGPLAVPARAVVVHTRLAMMLIAGLLFM